MSETNLEKAKRLLHANEDICRWLNSGRLSDIEKMLELAATPEVPGMVIRSKFNHGQTVFFMHENKIHSGKITGMTGESGTGTGGDWHRVKLRVLFSGLDSNGRESQKVSEIPEYEFFASLAALTEYLSKDIVGEK